MNKFFIWSVLALFQSSSVFSKEFTIVDQNNVPLEGAVLEIIPQKLAETEDNKLDTYIIDQIGKQFVPQLLVISAGSKVNFPNSDNIRHHVYSFSQAKTFELKLYSGQPKDPINFPQHGVVVLGCNIHDTMVGHIYVAKSEYVATSDEKGKLNIGLPTAAIDTINLWHRNYQAGAENVLKLTPSQLNNTDKLIIDIKPEEPRNTFKELFKDKSQ